MSVYFVSKNRLFSGLASCRPSIQNQWNGGGGNGGGLIINTSTPKSFKSTQPQSPPPTSSALSNTSNTANGYQQGAHNGNHNGSSRKGKTQQQQPHHHHHHHHHHHGRTKTYRKSWRWRAGAGWTILSVLDWWLIAAGGWFTLRGVFLKWTPIGICIVAAVQWQMHAHRRSGGQQQLMPQRTATHWQTTVYCSLPLRLMSRTWGWLADCRVPVPVRPLVYGCYSAAFGVNLQEAISSDFKDYRSLAEFFTRPLKENARLIDAASCLVSPADGRVLHFGPANSDQVEQVKGVTYSLQSFLGPANWAADVRPSYADSVRLQRHADTELYQCIIYLAPGDYHRFHSPAVWQPELRRHFVGELLSVSPQVAHWLPGLFALNERALYMGRWQHGFFSFTAVGATNVGSVQIYIDEALRTNRWQGLCCGRQNGSDEAPDYDEVRLPAETALAKGELLGQFNMGSTVVLVFEAPRGFEFAVQPGQTIRMGEPLGRVQAAPLPEAAA